MLDKPISPLRPAHDRRHDGAPFPMSIPRGTTFGMLRNVCGLPRPVARYGGEGGRFASFQLHMAKQQMSAGSINAAIAALRFFFTVTLERPDLVLPLTTVNKPRRAPGRAEPQEEVARLLESRARR